MKYKIIPTNKFRKDLKREEKRGRDLQLIKAVIRCIAEGNGLDPKYRDHALTRNFSGYRECHILPDWLLIYRVTESDLILTLTRTGSHSDLF